MNHNEFLASELTYRYNEVGFKYECVWGVKLYAKEVQGIKLGSFNGEADKATFKPGWTYDPKYRKQLTSWPWTDLKQWDHIIQKMGVTGHVWVVHRADANGYYLLNQNAKWSKSWLGYDAYMIDYYTRKARPIISIYRKK